MMTIREDCPLCKSNDINFYTQSYDKHYGWINNKYDVFKCNNCKLYFLNPMIEDSELFRMYPEDYYNTEDIDSCVAKIIKKRKFKWIKDLLSKMDPKDLENDFNQKKVLDLGVGDCEQLYKLKLKGAITYGTEIRDSACIIGEKLGLNISKGTLLEANYQDNFFDYVRSNHSFEHLTNPHETLAEMNRILKINGELFIGVPNTNSYTFKIFKRNWYYLGVPFHPYSYNNENLISLVEQHGFKVKQKSFNGNFNGLLGGFQILINLKNKKKSSEGLLMNKFSQIFFHQIARIFNLLHQGDCMEILFKKMS